MDLRMPRVDGVTAIRELARRGVPARVLVLTTYDTDSDVLPAIEAGATGYLLKDAPSEELFRAVEAAAQGQAALSPAVATRLMRQMRQPASEPLSQRELEVLELVARGSTNREAARQLFISEATVKTHLLHAYAKLGVNDRAAAVAAAFSRGYVTPSGEHDGRAWCSGPPRNGAARFRGCSVRRRMASSRVVVDDVARSGGDAVRNPDLMEIRR